ncbi:hypothetical protein FJY94_04285 [Candidatus Kaiserbacteria bacterium]|nr:hypothetical protein [Candidatus Kaiserbacteria bacterium]
MVFLHLSSTKDGHKIRCRNPACRLPKSFRGGIYVCEACGDKEPPPYQAPLPEKSAARPVKRQTVDLGRITLAQIASAHPTRSSGMPTV